MPKCDLNGDGIISGHELKCFNKIWRYYIPGNEYYVSPKWPPAKPPLDYIRYNRMKEDLYRAKVQAFTNEMIQTSEKYMEVLSSQQDSLELIWTGKRDLM